MRTVEEIKQALQHKLVVSCQALPEEPLHSPYIMGRMAYAAMLGGASGIRANSVADIKEIKTVVNLPIIGIIKQVYDNCPVFITPTEKEIDALVAEGVDIIALDATHRPRPDGKTLTSLFQTIRAKYPNQLFMADCATLEDGIIAEQLGFDFIGTTLSGYTADTKGKALPDFNLVADYVKQLKTPIIAEGGISTPDELKKMFELGVFSAVVGSAITRPMEITKKFTDVLVK